VQRKVLTENKPYEPGKDQRGSTGLTNEVESGKWGIIKTKQLTINSY